MDVSEKISETEYIEFINQNRVKLFKTAIAILRNEDDACDAIQETLISSYKNLDSLQNKEYLKTWVTRILINKCYDILNKNKKISYLDGEIIEETNGYYDNYKIESNLESALNKIDKDLKEVVILYYYDELSVAEIANILSIPNGTVKSRLSRARKQLSEIIKKEEGEV